MDRSERQSVDPVRRGVHGPGVSVFGGVFHLPRNSGNSGWDVNGRHVFGSFHWKISGINGTSEKVVLFSRWKLSDGNASSIYNFSKVLPLPGYSRPHC